MEKKGTAESPFEIRCADDLKILRQNRMSHFVLTDDINIKNSFLPNLLLRYIPDEKIWSFYGLGDFHGELDGQGHTIYGLRRVEYSDFPGGSSSSIGLFNTNNGKIKNLNIESLLVSGGNSIGTIAGKNFGEIKNCSINGRVKGKRNIGGIVGKNDKSGRIIGCEFNGKIKTYDYSGGICGRNEGEIRSCESKSKICGERQLGGITGMNGNGGTIESSFSTCRLGKRYIDEREGYQTEGIGTDYIGGITSGNFGMIKNSYCKLSKIGLTEINIGGLSGLNYGEIRNCYIINENNVSVNPVKDRNVGCMENVGVRENIKEAEKSIIADEI